MFLGKKMVHPGLIESKTNLFIVELHSEKALNRKYLEK